MPDGASRLARGLVLIGIALALAGCGSGAYYWQAAAGHLALLRASRPVDDWLGDPALDARLRARLLLARRIRDFASAELALPDNASYRGYADLGRPAAVWNVVAAPVDSLELRTWCYPVLGCAGYRGYYAQADAQALAAQLRAEGLDVGVYGVPAYSTLGRLDWLGADPLLNTFIHWPEGELARLIIHELAHQVVYVADDTAFNESFATAVERLGGARWLERHADAAARREYAAFDARRLRFRALQAEARAALQSLYVRASGPDRVAERVAGKAAILAGLADRLGDEARRDPSPQTEAMARWARGANNATLAIAGAYDDGVPAFEALFRKAGADWPRFYDAVRSLAAEPREVRRARLKELIDVAHPHPS